MQHKIYPLFSVPLFKTNIGPLDTIERTWIDSLEYPDKAVARDSSDDHMEPVNRGMHILNSGQLKKAKRRFRADKRKSLDNLNRVGKKNSQIYVNNKQKC